MDAAVTVGLDGGDRDSYVCILDAAGAIVEEGRVATTPAALRQRFAGSPPLRIVLEVGSHSPWISRLLTDCGHEVLVANARRVRLISQSDTKTDRIDAEAQAATTLALTEETFSWKTRGPCGPLVLCCRTGRTAPHGIGGH